MGDPATSMYYTFSTIAQVLAAFLALSGVFVIFKIQYFKKAMLFQANEFFQIIVSVNNKKGFVLGSNAKKVDPLRSMIESESIKGIHKEMHNLFKDTDLVIGHNSEFLSERISVFKKINNNRKFILGLTIISLIVGVLTIMGSIYILSTVHKEICISNDWIYRGGFTGTGTSIILMVWAIIISLKEKKLI